MKEREPEPPADVPAWLMTYSDVVTLMMTFFILLMTFSTTEKENFERLKVAMFSGGDASGFVGDGKNLDDSLVYRERPRASRKSMRGSETPPIHRDATTDSLKKGLESLKTDPRDPSATRSMLMRLQMLIKETGEVSSFGEQMMKLLARQLGRFPLDVTLVVSREDEAGHAVALAMHLTETLGILPGRIAVGVDRSNPAGSLQIATRRPLANDRR